MIHADSCGMQARTCHDSVCCQSATSIVKHARKGSADNRMLRPQTRSHEMAGNKSLTILGRYLNRKGSVARYAQEQQSWRLLNKGFGVAGQQVLGNGSPNVHRCVCVAPAGASNHVHPALAQTISGLQVLSTRSSPSLLCCILAWAAAASGQHQEPCP